MRRAPVVLLLGRGLSRERVTILSLSIRHQLKFFSRGVRVTVSGKDLYKKVLPHISRILALGASITFINLMN